MITAEGLIAAYALLGFFLVVWKATWFLRACPNDPDARRLSLAIGLDVLSEAYNIGIVFLFAMFALYSDGETQIVSEDTKALLRLSMVTAALVTTLNVYRCFKEIGCDRASNPPG